MSDINKSNKFEEFFLACTNPYCSSTRFETLVEVNNNGKPDIINSESNHYFTCNECHYDVRWTSNVKKKNWRGYFYSNGSVNIIDINKPLFQDVKIKEAKLLYSAPILNASSREDATTSFRKMVADYIAYS